MKIHTALALRMEQLAKERGKTVVEIGKLGGLRQSTISEIMQGRSQHPKISTIKLYCDGCEITLSEFFQSELFENVEVPKRKKYNQD